LTASGFVADWSNTNLTVMEKTGRDDGTNGNNGTNGKIRENFRLFRHLASSHHHKVRY
jgi:hypothetical protein